jgi:hypothetical protein
MSHQLYTNGTQVFAASSLPIPEVNTHPDPTCPITPSPIVFGIDPQLPAIHQSLIHVFIALDSIHHSQLEIQRRLTALESSKQQYCIDTASKCEETSLRVSQEFSRITQLASSVLTLSRHCRQLESRDHPFPQPPPNSDRYTPLMNLDLIRFSQSNPLPLTPRSQ